MDAYEEMVTSGTAGPATLELLLEVTAQTVRSRNYPDPGGRGSWNEDDIAELAHEVVLACSEGGSFVDEMLTSAVEEQGIRAVVAHRVRIAFAERSRRTDTGHLAGRIGKLLKDGDFMPVETRSWAAPETSGDRLEYPATATQLLRAAHQVPDVRMTRWNPAAERRSPFATQQDLTRLVRGVLLAAGEPIAESLLVKVLADYFGLSPAAVSLDGAEVAAPPLAAPDDVPLEAEAGILAEMIWLQLREDERAMLPWLEDSLSDAAAALGISKTQAHRVRAATRTVLSRALGLAAEGGPEPGRDNGSAEVLRALQERSVTGQAAGVDES